MTYMSDKNSWLYKTKLHTDYYWDHDKTMWTEQSLCYYSNSAMIFQYLFGLSLNVLFKQHLNRCIAFKKRKEPLWNYDIKSLLLGHVPSRRGGIPRLKGLKRLLKRKHWTATIPWSAVSKRMGMPNNNVRLRKGDDEWHINTKRTKSALLSINLRKNPPLLVEKST